MDFQNAGIIQNIFIPWKALRSIKETCLVGNKASTQELITLFLVYIPIVKQELEGVSRNTDEHVITWQIVPWVLYVQLSGFPALSFLTNTGCAKQLSNMHNVCDMESYITYITGSCLWNKWLRFIIDTSAEFRN